MTYDDDDDKMPFDEDDEADDTKTSHWLHHASYETSCLLLPLAYSALHLPVHASRTKLAGNFPTPSAHIPIVLRPAPLYPDKLYKRVTDVDSPSHLLADNDNRPSGPLMTLAQLTGCYRTLGVLLRRASVPWNRCDFLSRAAVSGQLELFGAGRESK